MFDKVIMALKKRQQGAAGPQMQLPSMNMDEDDTPPLPPGGYPAPPLPPGPGHEPPPPLPNDPKTYDDSFLDDESEVNDLVLSIVQDLDKNITEEEKLRVAQEKLAKILQKKAQQRYVENLILSGSKFCNIYISRFRIFQKLFVSMWREVYSFLGIWGP